MADNKKSRERKIQEVIDSLDRKPAVTVPCPICKKPAQASNSDFPFCSARCRLLDLGKWASGEYVVSSPVSDAEERIQDRLPEDPDEQP